MKMFQRFSLMILSLFLALTMIISLTNSFGYMVDRDEAETVVLVVNDEFPAAEEELQLLDPEQVIDPDQIYDIDQDTDIVEPTGEDAAEDETKQDESQPTDEQPTDEIPEPEEPIEAEDTEPDEEEQEEPAEDPTDDEDEAEEGDEPKTAEDETQDATVSSSETVEVEHEEKPEISATITGPEE